METLVRGLEHHLRGVSEGQIPSARHTAYHSRLRSEKRRLTSPEGVKFGLFSGAHFAAIPRMVAKVVGKAEKDPYVFQVLTAEVVIKNLQAQLDLTTEEAENWERRLRIGRGGAP